MVVLFPPPDLASCLVDKPLQTFEEACLEAADASHPLVLTQDVTLKDTIRLRSQQQLVIQGNAPHHATNDNHRPSISGNVHSLFLLNNKSSLILTNVDLIHTLQTDNHKEVGAAVNLRSKATLSATNCTIRSISGFSVWAVQKCQVNLTSCLLMSQARSPLVCFGNVNCTLTNCRIEKAGVHAICGRGCVRLRLQSCHIVDSAARAIYAYAGAAVHLEQCCISGTSHPHKAAIEVASMAPNSKDDVSTDSVSNSQTLKSTLTIGGSQIVDNCGVGIRLRGPVTYHETGTNILARNAGGNLELAQQESEEDKSLSPSNINKHNNSSPIRRDAAGSSFRRGDWYCQACESCVIGRAESCPSCGDTKALNGRLLTLNEIGLLNKGVDIRKTNPKNYLFKGLEVAWYFDGDDEKGWILYDKESCHRLEQLYQKFRNERVDSPVTLLSGGKYKVNVVTMEQVNVETHFLRMIRRQENLG